MEVSTSTIMVAKTLTFAVFAAHEVIRPAFEAAKDQVADQNHSCFESFSSSRLPKSAQARRRHLAESPRSLLVPVGGFMSRTHRLHERSPDVIGTSSGSCCGIAGRISSGVGA